MCIEISCVHITGQIGGSVIHPGIFIDLTAEEFAAVGSFFTDDLCFFHILLITDQQGTALSHAVILRLMETVSAEITDGSQCFSLIGGHDSLGRILYHFQIVTSCNVHDRVHLACHAGIMYRHDRFRLLRNGILDQCLINVHGIRADIHEHRYRTTEYKSIRCGYKSIRGHDHFIPGLDITQKCRQLCCMGAGSG